ncbi:MAG: Rieske 2Fe-2S domain-containing protein [Alphaproteobacteria bacterium]|nr:Rieske 2Fe-2S domain-containing protein [Alphaproteobacteria bacterium]
MDAKYGREGEHWLNLGNIPELAEKGRHVVKVDGKQIALFQTEEGLFAINNRCPHEGYPLSEGTLNDGCTLACNWHGWSFNLKSGKAVQGRDPVNTYPIDHRDGDIWIDLTPPPPEEVAARAFVELDEALAEHDYERIARSLSRLEKAGVAFEEAARRVVRWSLPRFERGFGHAHAGLSDWIDLAGEDDELRLVAFLEALGHFSWDALFSLGLEPGGAVSPWDAAGFIADVEAMNSSAALAKVRGAFAAGLRFANIKPAYLDFIFSHYGGFGHQAIYALKLERLVDQLGPDIEETISLQLATYLCLSAREDLIPEFRSFSDYLKVEKGNVPVPGAEAFSGQSVRKTMATTAASLAHAEELFDSLLAANALNMLHFDLARQDVVEQPIAQNVGWLDFTHAITFAEAARSHALEEPKYWQSALIQMACFVGRNAKFVTPKDWAEWQVSDVSAFLAKEKARLFDMDAGEYIYGVHRLKMICAVEALLPVVSDKTRTLVLAALNRYLNSPMRYRHSARAAFQARQTVLREG